MLGRKPKIAVIGLKGLPALGGASVVGENIINQLKDKYDFTVFSLSSHAGTLPSHENSIKQYVFQSLKNKKFNTLFYYIRSLLYCLFKGDFDLVHLHHAASGYITAFLRTKYKVVTTFHGIFFRRKDKKFGLLENIFFKISEQLNLLFSNVVISVSDVDREEISKYSRKYVRYIPNGVEVKKIEKNTSGYILFAAARIFEIKGLHILLEALKKIDCELKLKVVGDIDQKESYKEKILKQCKGLNIEFVGLIKDKSVLAEIVSNAKIFIFPSTQEAMSMMLLEAASVNTPVIASNIPANMKIFDDSEITFFESGNSDDLALKIKNILDNYKDAQDKSKKALNRLSVDYSWQVVASKYEEIFNSLIKN